MKTLSKLNLNTNPSTFQNGDIKYAKNIVATVDQKAVCNEQGFSLVNTYSETIIGKIEIPNGYVLCLKGQTTDKIVCIDNGITKTIFSNYFNFNINNPIKGRYTFNSNNDLYITLSEGISPTSNETRIINITQSPTTLTKDQVDNLTLIPNLIYPTMFFEVVKEGSLLVGTYQIAIAYQVEEAIYTNYSILSEPVYVFGNLEDHNKIGTSITRAIKITFDTIDTRYIKFKIGILYKGEDAFEKCYETDDILTSVATYNISNLDSLSSTSIDALTIGSISYVKDNDHTTFNGRMIRTNVQTVNYTGLDDVMNNIASKVQITLNTYIPDNGFDKEVINQTKHFKAGEHYIIYIGCFDYKGNFVNAYPIPWKEGDQTEMVYINSSHTTTKHRIPYVENETTTFAKHVSKLYVTLPSNIDTLLGSLSTIITSFCYFYAEHNLTNSKVLGQGYIIRDTVINDFNNEQSYWGPFHSSTKLRFYSFEHLFNKSVLSNVSIYGHNNLPNFDNSEYSEINGALGEYAKIYATTDSIPIKKVNIPINKIEYIDNDNTILDNIAGDSFHRLTLSEDNTDILFESNPLDRPFPNSYYNIIYMWLSSTTVYDQLNHVGSNKVAVIADIISNNNYFYDDVYKQRLVICSNIINKNTNTTSLTGDFFYNNLTLRLTTPTSMYRYGTDDLSLQLDAAVYKVIISINIESRFNIKARYSGVNDYQKVFNIQNTLPATIKPIINIPYKYDNFINTSEGKGYNLSCHNNGYNNIIYDKKLDIRCNFFNRIVRSIVNNVESKGIAWRIFNANDYKDLPIERGKGQLIESDERAIYIQQEYALFVASIRDQLGNNAANDTFLGSSDLFDRDPIEILYEKNGYIGCDNRFAGISTPFGYVVVDSILKNIFLVKLTQPKKLNDLDTEQWFRDNLVKGLINPYNKQGISLLYDDKIKSLFLTQQGSDKDFTIHYNFSNNGGWLSFHDYIVEGYISNRLGTYCIINNSIYSRHVNNICIFTGTTKRTSEITYIFNTQFDVFKQILGISWDTFIKSGNRVIYDNTINTLMIYNDTQCTGVIHINNFTDWFDTASGVYKKDQWYFNNITDKVIDDKLPFVDDKGNIIGNMGTTLDWFSESSFISKYIYIKFGMNNINQNTIVLNSYDVNAIKSIR